MAQLSSKIVVRGQEIEFGLGDRAFITRAHHVFIDDQERKENAFVARITFIGIILGIPTCNRSPSGTEMLNWGETPDNYLRAYH